MVDAGSADPRKTIPATGEKTVVHSTPLHPPTDDSSNSTPQTEKDQDEVRAPVAPSLASAVTLCSKTGHTGMDRPSIAGYEVMAELGRGGMGVVYKARHLKLNRIVALKMILSGLHASQADLRRFVTEAEVVASLHHVNIVQVYEVGQHQGLPFMALEYVGGGSLADRLKGTPLQPREAAQLVLQMAEGIRAAHDAGIVHRDLKPGNILLTEARDEGQGASTEKPDDAPVTPRLTAPLTAKITDFGLSKRVEEGKGLTQTGAIMGTPAYMAPEQAGGKSKEVGPATDVYALGAILYECLTGRPPFQAPAPLDTVMLVMDREPVPPSQLQPKTPRDLETICLKCLHKEAGKRYGSADALADDLRRFLQDQPILARRTGWSERSWRWCRRNPVLAVMTASVAALLVVIAAGASIAALRLNEERKTALKNLDRAIEAEKIGKEKLRQSFLDQARAGRWSGRPGRRFLSLEALRKAADIRAGLDLRNEAIACLALADLRTGKERDIWLPGTTAIVFDVDLEHYARSHCQGHISLRRFADDKEIKALPGTGAKARALKFSPDGKYLAAVYTKDLVARLQVWDVNNAKAVLQVADRTRHHALDFSPDSRRLAISLPDKSIAIYDLGTGKEVQRLPAGPEPHTLAFHPTGSKLAVSSHLANEVHVHDLDSSKTVPLKHPAVTRGVAWRGDGELLACAAADSRIYVWKLRPAPQIQAILQGHDHVTVQVAFNHQGDLLASNSWDGTTRLWDPLTGKQHLSAQGGGGQLLFSSDDRRLGIATFAGSKTGYWEVATTRLFHRLHLGGKIITFEVSLSPDGRLLAHGDPGSLSLWDVAYQKEVVHLPGFGSVMSSMFHPDGKSLITSGGAGIQRWPIRCSRDADMQLGPPQLLQRGPTGHARLCRNGRLLIFQAGHQAHVLDLHEPKSPLQSFAHANLGSVAISSPGKWAATGAWQGTGVSVWDTRSGKRLKDLPIDTSAVVAFSPDDKWLLVGTGVDFQFWRTGTWELARRIDRDRGGGFPGSVAFSPTADMLAIAYSPTVVQLIEPESGRQLASLESPYPLNMSGLCFSEDGSQLMVATDYLIQHWDLRLLRRRLAEMKLDWDGPELAAAESGPMKPLRINVIRKAVIPLFKRITPPPDAKGKSER